MKLETRNNREKQWNTVGHFFTVTSLAVSSLVSLLPHCPLLSIPARLPERRFLIVGPVLKTPRWLPATENQHQLHTTPGHTLNVQAHGRFQSPLLPPFGPLASSQGRQYPRNDPAREPLLCTWTVPSRYLCLYLLSNMECSSAMKRKAWHEMLPGWSLRTLHSVR